MASGQLYPKWLPWGQLYPKWLAWARWLFEPLKCSVSRAADLDLDLY